jgi:hypothetical protein
MPTKKTRWTETHEAQRAGAAAAAAYQNDVLSQQLKLLRAARQAIRDGALDEAAQLIADAGIIAGEALAEARAILRLMEAAARGR